MRTLFPWPLVSGTHLFDVVLGYRIMGFSGRRLLAMFPYSALVGSTLDTCLRQSRCSFALQRNALFDSGYKFASVYGAFVFRAMLGSTVDTNLCQSTELPYFNAMQGLTVDTICVSLRSSCCGPHSASCLEVDVAVYTERQIPAARFDSWDEGWTFWGPVRRHRAGSHVHRDTAPIIRCRTVVAYRQRHVMYIASGPQPPQPPQPTEPSPPPPPFCPRWPPAQVCR